MPSSTMSRGQKAFFFFLCIFILSSVSTLDVIFGCTQNDNSATKGRGGDYITKTCFNTKINIKAINCIEMAVQKIQQCP